MSADSCQMILWKTKTGNKKMASTACMMPKFKTIEARVLNKTVPLYTSITNEPFQTVNSDYKPT